MQRLHCHGCANVSTCLWLYGTLCPTLLKWGFFINQRLPKFDIGSRGVKFWTMEFSNWSWEEKRGRRNRKRNRKRRNSGEGGREQKRKSTSHMPYGEVRLACCRLLLLPSFSWLILRHLSALGVTDTITGKPSLTSLPRSNFHYRFPWHGISLLHDL